MLQRKPRKKVEAPGSRLHLDKASVRFAILPHVMRFVRFAASNAAAAKAT